MDSLSNVVYLVRGGKPWNDVPRQDLLRHHLDHAVFFAPKGIIQAIKNRLQKS